MNQEEFDYWQPKVVEIRRTQLDTVKKSATAFSTLLTAVLGVFGTATFVTGMPSLDDLEGSLAWGLRVAVVAVAALLLLAVVTGGLASTRYPRVTNSLTAIELRDHTKAAAQQAHTLLNISLASGGLAVAVLIAGSVVVALAPTTGRPSEPPTVLVVSGAGASCGQLERNSQGALVVQDELIVDGTTVTLVDACP